MLASYVAICRWRTFVSYVGGEQLRTSMKATSLPSSIDSLLIDLQGPSYGNY